MNIDIDKAKIKNIELDAYRKGCSEALDKLWEQEWIRRSVTGADKEMLDEIQAFAEEIGQKNKKVAIVTSGDISRLVKAVIGLIPENDDVPEMVLLGDSVSPLDYANVINAVDDDEFVLLAITGEDDGIAVRGAYAILKQLLVSKYGLDKAADNTFVIASDKTKSIAADAVENDLEYLIYSTDVPELYAAGTVPALVLLALGGLDITDYLHGFDEAISSPLWDLDAADYSMARAAYFEKYHGNESIIHWQRQLHGFSEWLAAFNNGPEARSVYMPGDKKKDRENDFGTYFSIERDEDDIIMPYFDGCRGEGSLNMLLVESADEYFFTQTKDRTGVKISIECADAYDLGQLFAFVQLSNGITEFLCNK